MLIDLGAILIMLATFIGLYTTIFFFLTIYENWGRHHTPLKRNNLPTVCIIVPCYNEEKTLVRTMDSLLAVEYPAAKLELMIVDDGSKDKTYAIAREYARRFPARVKAYRKKNGGKHTALNLGIKKTDAEFVGALDADSTVAADALRKILSYFDDPNVMAVTPSMVINTPKGVLRRIQSIEFLFGVFLRRVFADLGSQNVTPGPFTIYRHEFFKRYGAYRKAHMTEDIEVALRIQSHDYLIENATDAYVYTHGPATWKGLYKQRLRWYHGFLCNIMDYKELFSKKHGNLGLFILPLSFLSLGVVTLLLAYTIIKGVSELIQQLHYYWLIGFDVTKLFELHLTWFFVNTGPLVVLGVVTFCGTLSLIYLGKRFANEHRIVYSYLFFMLFYSWLYVFWWLVAFYHKLLKRSVTWGHKSSTE